MRRIPKKNSLMELTHDKTTNWSSIEFLNFLRSLLDSPTYRLYDTNAILPRRTFNPFFVIAHTSYVDSVFVRSEETKLRWTPFRLEIVSVSSLIFWWFVRMLSDIQRVPKADSFDSTTSRKCLMMERKSVYHFVSRYRISETHLTKSSKDQRRNWWELTCSSSHNKATFLHFEQRQSPNDEQLLRDLWVFLSGLCRKIHRQDHINIAQQNKRTRMGPER